MTRARAGYSLQTTGRRPPDQPPSERGVAVSSPPDWKLAPRSCILQDGHAPATWPQSMEHAGSGLRGHEHRGSSTKVQSLPS